MKAQILIYDIKYEYRGHVRVISMHVFVLYFLMYEYIAYYVIMCMLRMNLRIVGDWLHSFLTIYLNPSITLLAFVCVPSTN